MNNKDNNLKEILEEIKASLINDLSIIYLSIILLFYNLPIKSLGYWIILLPTYLLVRISQVYFKEGKIFNKKNFHINQKESR